MQEERSGRIFEKLCKTLISKSGQNFFWIGPATRVLNAAGGLRGEASHYTLCMPLAKVDASSPTWRSLYSICSAPMSLKSSCSSFGWHSEDLLVLSLSCPDSVSQPRHQHSNHGARHRENLLGSTLSRSASSWVCWLVLVNWVLVLYIELLNTKIFKQEGISWEWAIVIVTVVFFLLSEIYESWLCAFFVSWFVSWEDTNVIQCRSEQFNPYWCRQYYEVK